MSPSLRVLYAVLTAVLMCHVAAEPSRDRVAALLLWLAYWWAREQMCRLEREVERLQAKVRVREFWYSVSKGKR